MPAPPNLRRRALLAAGGALTAGILGWSATRPGAPALLPQGWYIVIRAGQSANLRQLVALGAPAHAERRIDAGMDVRYLAFAASPDGRWLAVLKRVPRGSMPNDAIAIFDRRSLRRQSEVGVEIPFQSSPTYSLSWSADGARLAVPYNIAGRTLLFSISPAGRIALNAMGEYAYFRFHPVQANVAASEQRSASGDSTTIFEFVPGARERPLETVSGAEASWSPDGSRLAYLSGRGAAQTLDVRVLASGQVATSLPLRPIAKAWSPDSTRLAVYADVVSDPLHLHGIIPDGMLPGYPRSTPAPQLSVHDLASGASYATRNLPRGFELARLQWLDQNWLLVAAAQNGMSFVTDRQLGRRLPITEWVGVAPLLGWLAA
jgi:hypothetical protein